MASFEVDAHELRAFASDLLRGLDKVPAEARQVINRGALNIKNQMQSEMRASRHFRGAAHRISYDMTGNAAHAEAEIGPTSGRGDPGSLGNIAYFGTSRGGASVADPRGALDAEIPNVEKWLGDVAEGIV